MILIVPTNPIPNYTDPLHADSKTVTIGVGGPALGGTSELERLAEVVVNRAIADALGGMGS